MEQRQLGQNGPLVGAVGYGAMSFSDFYGPAQDDSSLKLLDLCLELGITHLDTSNVYGSGRSERVIGEWLRQKGGECPFFVATKGGISGDDTRRFNNDPAYLETCLNDSLSRLGLEAVDLYYVHRREADIPIEEVTGTLAGFVQAGKVKSIGFSEIAPSSLRKAHAVHPVAAVQSEYSLSTRSPEMGLVQTCAELDVSLVAFSPVGRGLLTDRPHNADAVAGMSFLKVNPRFMEPNLTQNLKVTEAFRALAGDMGVASASLAIAWLLHQGSHVLPIPGTRHATHLREVAASADIKLSADDLAQIEAVLPIGWAHGDRYSKRQWEGPERYC